MIRWLLSIGAGRAVLTAVRTRGHQALAEPVLRSDVLMQARRATAVQQDKGRG